jgi:16S rRNA (adenine1518-N6/adenine1519-N6)-dimethyltransferase
MAAHPLSDSGDEPPRQSEPATVNPVIPPGQFPTTPSEIKTLLRALGVRPQKGFGQNFLTNEKVLRRIVDSGNVARSDVVVEIGPGLGHLTHHLARVAGRVICLEIDRGFIQELRRAFQYTPSVEILEQDVLHFDPSGALGSVPYKVVANLPYYITSAVLRHFLEATRRPTTLVVTVQREVGDRILAKLGDLNLLAISVAVFGRPRLVMRVPPNAFYPQPKVESVVIGVDVYDRPTIKSPADRYFKVVAAGFAMPRKQIHNSLAQRLWMPPGEAPRILQQVGIDPMRRPQTLSIAEWDELTLELERRGLV